MTTVEINPGVCGFVAIVSAESDDEQMVNLQIKSGCGGIKKLAEKLGDEIDAFEVCLCRPGTGEIYEIAQEVCPGHASCPVMCTEELALWNIKDKSSCAWYQVQLATKRWLDQYFAGEKPEVSELPLAPAGWW